MLFAALAIISFFPIFMHAYIDPGTGSYLIQLLIAGFVAASFAVKIFWKKIKGFFSRLFGRQKEEDAVDE